MCPTCLGAAPFQRSDSSQCRWCRDQTAAQCGACGAGIHFLGQCSRWNRGADEWYAPDAAGNRMLCPDCAWDWGRAMCGVVQVENPGVPRSQIMNLMSAAARHRTSGAGAQRGSCISQQRASRWIRRHLRPDTWTAQTTFVNNAASAMSSPSEMASARDAIVAAIDGLGRSGVIGRSPVENMSACCEVRNSRK